MPEAAQSAPAAAPGAQPGTSIDPYRAYNFKLQIQGVNEGHFTACSGLDIEVEAIPYREGGVGQVVHQIPGQVIYGAITLSYGLTASNELFQWLLTAVRGTVERRNVSILMLDSGGTTEVLRWDLTNAWPSRWCGAPLDAQSHEVAIESLTLVCETITRG